MTPLIPDTHRVGPKKRNFPMLRLAGMLYSLIATTLAGVGVIAVLTAGYTAVTPIVGAAALGALVALPVSYLVAKRITG